MTREISNGIRVAVIAMMLACFLSGCVFSIGGGKGKDCEVKQGATAGQELIDLKKALDQEVITQDEYNQKKEQILKK